MKFKENLLLMSYFVLNIIKMCAFCGRVSRKTGQILFILDLALRVPEFELDRILTISYKIENIKRERVTLNSRNK